jgi:hypothetical protein
MKQLKICFKKPIKKLILIIVIFFIFCYKNREPFLAILQFESGFLAFASVGIYK